MSKFVIIDLEHVARKSVHAVVSACTLSLAPLSAIYILHSKAVPVVVPLPLSEGLVKLPLNFVRIPTSISRSKDAAIFLSGYLSGCKGVSADDDVWFVSSRSTWFTSEILNCKTVSTIRTTEEIVAFSSSIGVDVTMLCGNNAAVPAITEAPATAFSSTGAANTESSKAGSAETALLEPAASDKPQKTKRAAKTTDGAETKAAAPARAKKQKRAEVLDVSTDASFAPAIAL